MPIVIALLSAQITIKSGEKTLMNFLFFLEMGAEDTVMCVYVFLSFFLFARLFLIKTEKITRLNCHSFHNSVSAFLEGLMCDNCSNILHDIGMQ